MCTFARKYVTFMIGKSFRMKLKVLIAECTAYNFKVMLEEKNPKNWLKSVFLSIDNDGIVRGLNDDDSRMFKIYLV